MPSSNEIALGTRIREDTPLSDVDLGKGLFIYYVIADGGQALAGSRDFQLVKIPGFWKMKSRDFSGSAYRV